jgi:hypothetical protein
MDKFVNAELVLKKFFSNFGISEELGKLYSVWEQVVGAKLAKKL